MLGTAFFALKREAAPDVDGLTWRAYAADLDHRIEDLHGRVERGAYRAFAITTTVHPKADGNQRPLAVAAVEDTLTDRPPMTTRWRGGGAPLARLVGGRSGVPPRIANFHTSEDANTSRMS
jgi:hypothetical protein